MRFSKTYSNRIINLDYYDYSIVSVQPNFKLLIV